MLNQTPNQTSIILVDDEPAVLSALTLLLETLSFRVTSFSSGQEALLYLATGGKASLFLCDLRMPGLNGMDTLAKMMEIAPEIPFVLISAHATKEDVRAAIAKGARGFLGKPFSPEELENLFAGISPSPAGA
jgi:two-component system nitrogen regulation response regulator NtrX